MQNITNHLNDSITSLYTHLHSELPLFETSWVEYTKPNYTNSEDEILIGEERYIPMRFYKDFNIFRLSELNTKIITVDDKLQLPNGSLLHTLENFNRPLIDPTKPIETKTTFESCDTPNMETNEFIAQESSRRFMYHITDFDTEGPFQYEDKYILLKMNQNKNFMSFKSRYQSKCRILTSLKSIPPQPMTLSIVNHNSLFRVIVRGTLNHYRRFNLIFSSIFNTVCKCPTDKQQFIEIPLNYEIYEPTAFLKTRHVMNTNTLRFKTRMQYMLLVHLFNFIDPDATASMFHQFPKDMYDKINFILRSDKYAIIFSLKDLTKICNTPATYRKFIMLVNNLVESGRRARVLNELEMQQALDNGEIKETSDEIEETSLGDAVVQKTIETVSKVTEVKTVSEETKDKAKAILDEIIRAEEEITVHEDDGTVIEDYSTESVLDEGEETDSFDGEFTAPALPKSNLHTTQDIKRPNITPIEAEVDQAEVGTIEELHEAFSNDIDLPTRKTSLSEVKPAITEKETIALGTIKLKNIDEAASQIIDNSPHLNPKQRQRLKIVSQKYKTITLGNQTIEQILKEGVDTSLDVEQTSEVLEDYVEDKSMTKSSITELDKLYVDKYFKKDLVSVVTSFNKSGMFLTDMNTEDVISSISKTRVYTLRFEDVNNKKHTLKFELPLIDSRGHAMVDGTEYYFKKQIVALPICKLSETKVSLASNYNKTVVERNKTKAHNFLDYFQKIINGVNASYDKPMIDVNHGTHVFRDVELPYEYTRLGARFTKLTLHNPKNTRDKIVINLDYTNRFNGEPKSLQWSRLESRFGVYLGRRTTNDNQVLFLDNDSILHLVSLDANMKPVKTTKTCLVEMIVDLYEEYKSSTNVPPLTEWVDLRILGTKLPVGFILSYKFGLKTILDDLKIPHMLIPKRGGYNRQLNKSDIVIPFSDKNLVIPRYPLQKSLVIAGLRFFDTNQVAFEDMYIPDTYYTLLNMKGISTNYFKGIDSTFELFVDPITEEILLQMGEPTNYKDLLIRATEMVSSDFHKDATSSANHRIRSYERLNTVLYNTMAKQFSIYMNRTGAGNTFSLEPKLVLRRIMQDQAMMTVEEVNPIHDIKLKTSLTFAGFGGRTADSFVASDRRFSDDSVGVISESTVDSGAVGMTVGTSMDPQIVGIRGLIATNKEEVKPTNLLSVTGLLMPGVTNDDRLLVSHL